MSDSKSLPLATRLNIRDNYEGPKPELSERLKKAAGGVEFNFVVDFVDLYQNLEQNPDYRKRLGEVVFWYFEGLVRNLEDKLKDKMVLEAFIEAVSTRDIILELKSSESYYELAIEKSTLYIRTSPNNFGCNAGEIGRDIIDIL
ncbi:hypothetical protein BC937DRAFT_91365 [Endogone sp. FLAS-F59071]|nr:hypothetical protein BC937DRAFT_91365 [Endogone sp. FLAS-F59071]|eukprot:RUS16312.1 hypothetical protein BC937DRAFT_91365 [Endogone sp. FLAS-F59071]